MSKISLSPFILFFLVTMFSLALYAQKQEFNYILDEHGNRTGLINENPDPYGEPWIVGGIDVNSPEYLESMRSLPELKIANKVRGRSLPGKVDNSVEKPFRPVFSQTGGSCAQASSIGYNFTYMINCVRDLPGDEVENQYPYGYTYNFCNRGSSSNGSSTSQGYTIVEANGCPTLPDYGEAMNGGSATFWLSGYDAYYAGMHNKIQDQFRIRTEDSEGLDELKQYLFDQANGSSYGGVVTFGVNFSGREQEELPLGSDDEGYDVVIKWGTSGGHAMTIAGYNDDIYYDVNGDGQITTDIDITGDGVVDLRDSERGGVLFVNSHGTRYGTDGKAYMMYSLLAMDREQGGISSNSVRGCSVYDEYTPLLTCKARITHDTRDVLTITAGISNNVNATQPSDIKRFGKAFDEAGGAYPMCGEGESPTIEIGLDITELLEDITGTSAKIFLRIESSGGTGTVNSFSVMDYTGYSAQEITCDQQNVAISSGTTYLSVIRSNQTPIAGSSQNKVQKSGMLIRSIAEDHIDIVAPQDGIYSVTVNSVSGRMIKTVFKGHISWGTHTLGIDMHDVQSGMYIVQVNAPDTRVAKRWAKF